MQRTLLVLVFAACKPDDPPPLRAQWTDVFDRTELGVNYRASGAGYRIAAHPGDPWKISLSRDAAGVSDRALSAKGAHNHPLWLRKRLPRDVRLEFDCGSNDSRGDIKVELFGDGRSFDADGGRYTATGYELIFGGWSNSKSIIARMDEHAADVSQRILPKVIPHQRYHWKIERQGHMITWWIRSGVETEFQTPFLTYDDPQPLEGPGHEYFGFNNWETDTWFDNLVVTPL